MKHNILLLSALLVGTLAQAGETEGKTTATPSTPIIPIIVRKGQPNPYPRSPGVSMMIEGTIIDGLLYMDIPTEMLPCFVEIESAVSSEMTWTGAIVDENSSWIYFDGGVGEYEITITDTWNGVYKGYFNVE